VTEYKRTHIAFLAILLLSGCAKEKTIEQILPSEKAVCAGRKIANQYVVQWETGAVTVVTERDFEKFKSKFVEPHLNDIRRIEFDQKVFVEDVPVGSATMGTIGTANSIDNWGYSVAKADLAWQKGLRGKGVTVAVVDSGVDITHPSLRNQIAFNQGEAGPLANNGIDDDQNGFIDDYAGFNFHEKSGDLTDNVSHGTHVAGVIAGEHSETTVVNDELLGVAPEAKILPIKFLDINGGSLSAAIGAVEYAAQRGAKIINASWGGSGCSQILQEKIADVGRRGVLFVAASGNSGQNLEFSPEYPAAFKVFSQITVGAISPFLGMAFFSNYSVNLVDIFAPGQDIFSAVPGGAQKLSGTSMAAPFVAGAAALALSARPAMSVTELRGAVLQAITVEASYSNVTRGRLNLGLL
jgi:subtilisin family serine protease